MQALKLSLIRDKIKSNDTVVPEKPKTKDIQDKIEVDKIESRIFGNQIVEHKKNKPKGVIKRTYVKRTIVNGKFEETEKHTIVFESSKINSIQNKDIKFPKVNKETRNTANRKVCYEYAQRQGYYKYHKNQGFANKNRYFNYSKYQNYNNPGEYLLPTYRKRYNLTY